MQDDIAPVLQDPRALFVTFGRGRLVTTGFHLDPDLVGQSVHLASARAGRDHKKVHDRRNPREIEHDRILTPVLFAKPGNVAGVFQAALQSIFGSGGDNCGGNGKAPTTIENTFKKLQSMRIPDNRAFYEVHGLLCHSITNCQIILSTRLSRESVCDKVND